MNIRDFQIYDVASRCHFGLGEIADQLADWIKSNLEAAGSVLLRKATLSDWLNKINSQGGQAEAITELMAVGLGGAGGTVAAGIMGGPMALTAYLGSVLIPLIREALIAASERVFQLNERYLRFFQ